MAAIDDYLKKLDSRLQGMSPSRRKAVLAEVEGHLRDQAVELEGDELEAVRRFGDPFILADRLKSGEGGILQTYPALVGALVGHFGFLFWPTKPIHSHFSLPLWFALCAGVVVAGGFLARRLTLGSIGLSLAVNAAAVGLFTFSMWSFNPPASHPTPPIAFAAQISVTSLAPAAMLLAVWLVRQSASFLSRRLTSSR